MGRIMLTGRNVSLNNSYEDGKRKVARNRVSYIVFVYDVSNIWSYGAR